MEKFIYFAEGKDKQEDVFDVRKPSEIPFGVVTTPDSIVRINYSRVFCTQDLWKAIDLHNQIKGKE